MRTVKTHTRLLRGWMEQLTSRLIFRAVQRHRIKGVILYSLDNKRNYNYVYIGLKSSLEGIYFEF
jgi:hypothetical protein